MGVKTITLREEAYKLLLEMKKEKDSFSDVLLRAFGKKTVKKSRVMDFFGVLKDNKNLEEMEKEILEERKRNNCAATSISYLETFTRIYHKQLKKEEKYFTQFFSSTPIYFFDLKAVSHLDIFFI